MGWPLMERVDGMDADARGERSNAFGAFYADAAGDGRGPGIYGVWRIA